MIEVTTTRDYGTGLVPDHDYSVPDLGVVASVRRCKDGWLTSLAFGPDEWRTYHNEYAQHAKELAHTHADDLLA